MNSVKNALLEPNKIFEEVPVIIKNPYIVKALLHDAKTVQYHADTNVAEGSEEVLPV